MDIQKSVSKPQTHDPIILSAPETYIGSGSTPATYLDSPNATVEISNPPRDKDEQKISKVGWGLNDKADTEKIREQFSSAGLDPSDPQSLKGGITGTPTNIIQSKISELREGFKSKLKQEIGDLNRPNPIQEAISDMKAGIIPGVKRGVDNLTGAAETVGAAVGRGQALIEETLKPLGEAFLRGHEQGLRRGTKPLSNISPASPDRGLGL
jgi:hypothetical protein